MKLIAVAACLALQLGHSAVAATANPARPSPAPERGKRIFHGLDAVQGVIQKNGAALPAYASKCINCHSARTPGGATTGTAQYLTPATMARKLPRRGGPAYAYDQPAFCATVRTGVDPAGIVLESRMPRYKISDTQCADLWFYLSGIQ